MVGDSTRDILYYLCINFIFIFEIRYIDFTAKSAIKHFYFLPRICLKARILMTASKTVT